MQIPKIREPQLRFFLSTTLGLVIAVSLAIAQNAEPALDELQPLS